MPHPSLAAYLVSRTNTVYSPRVTSYFPIANEGTVKAFRGVELVAIAHGIGDAAQHVGEGRLGVGRPQIERAQVRGGHGGFGEPPEHGEVRRRAGVDPVSEDDRPSLPAMIAGVAVVVALVILIFFAIGYAFGRLFL